MTLLDSAFHRPDDIEPALGERVNLSVNPDDDEHAIVSHVLNLFQTARDHRRPLVQRWDRSYKFLRNRYWSDQRPGWMPAPAIPEIFPIVASVVGWMTDGSFHHTIAPASLPFSEVATETRKVADDLQLVMDSSYHVNDEEAEITKMLWDSQWIGTGILKTGWDMTRAGGLGDAVTRRVDPYGFYPDPSARSLEDANYFIEVKRMSIQEVDRRFPGSAEHFRSGGITHNIDQAPDGISPVGGRPPMANPGAIPPATGAPRYGLVGQSRISILEDPGVDVFEAWVREHYIFNDPETDDLRVMEGWRCIVIAGNNVLMNEPADNLWSHGSHPYSRYVPHDIGEFWGISLVELLVPTQDSINRILSAIQHNVELTGNPIWRETAQSGIGRQKIVNKPGQRVQTRQSAQPHNEVGWINPPQLHPAMPDLLRYMLQRMEAISGLSAITRGGTAPGRNAQGVIDALQEAAFVRIRIQQRSLETTLRRVGTLKASLIIEFYDTPRVMAVVGPSGEQSTMFLRGKHFYVDMGATQTPLQYTLLVDAGSGNHTSRKVREDQAITLFTLGAIDELTLLQMLEVPNAQGIYERVMELKGTGALQPPGQRQRARA